MVGFCDDYQFYTLIITLLIIENYQMRRWVAWIWWIGHRISRAWISWRRVTRRHWHLFQKKVDIFNIKQNSTYLVLSRVIIPGDLIPELHQDFAKMHLYSFSKYLLLIYVNPNHIRVFEIVHLDF